MGLIRKPKLLFVPPESPSSLATLSSTSHVWKFRRSTNSKSRVLSFA